MQERRRRDQEAAALLAKNAKYTLVEDEDDGPVRPVSRSGALSAGPTLSAPPVKAASAGKAAAASTASDGKSRKHLREKKPESGAWEDDGTDAVLQAARAKQARESAAAAAAAAGTASDVDAAGTMPKGTTGRAFCKRVEDGGGGWGWVGVWGVRFASVWKGGCARRHRAVS